MLFILFIIILFLLIILYKQVHTNKNYLLCCLFIFFIFIFVHNIKISTLSVISGCKLWFNSIFPTLFPFLVICNLLITFDGIKLFSKIIGPLICKPLNLSKNSSFALVASFLCGYPLGAKYSSDLYEQKYIEQKEYTNLLNIASNCSPLFIIGTIGSSLLGNIKAGYFLLLGNYISIILMGFILKSKKSTHNHVEFIENSSKKNFGDALKDSISSALSTTLSVGGFIILFCVIINIIKNNAYISIIFYQIEDYLNISKDLLYSLFLGCIEITNGCDLISKLNVDYSLKLSLISFLCSFSGLSIIAQTTSFTSKHEISVIRYSLLKLVQGGLSFIVTFLLSKISIFSIATSNICISENYNIVSFWYIPIIIIVLLFSFLKILDKLFHIP